MSHSVTRNASIPIGKSLQESRELLNQTAAALAVMQIEPLDFSGIDDISGIVNSAVSGNLLTVSELCAVRRTLRAARTLFERLKDGGDCSERYTILFEKKNACLLGLLFLFLILLMSYKLGLHWYFKFHKVKI